MTALPLGGLSNTADFLTRLAVAGTIEARVTPRFTQVVYPHDVAVFNSVLGVDPSDPDLPAIVDEASAPYRTQGTSSLWWMPATPDLGERLAELDMVEVQRLGVMSTAIDADPGEGRTLPDGWRVEPVRSPDRFEDWLGVWGAARRSDPDTLGHIGRVFAAPGFDDDAPLQHLLVTVDGRPAAGATLHGGGGHAGVYNVGTIPEARRLGLGRTVTAAAMREGAARGFTTATLQAEPELQAGYERLGFRVEDSVALFLRPATAR